MFSSFIFIKIPDSAINCNAAAILTAFKETGGIAKELFD
jgi:hypothetical protein